MTFTGKELSAILKMGISMAAADGKFADEEKAAICLELLKFGVSKNQFEQLLNNAEVMEASEAFAAIANMNDVQKKYVTGYLAFIMASDGDIADSEVKMWQLISSLACLPNMTMQEALTFWKNH